MFRATIQGGVYLTLMEERHAEVIFDAQKNSKAQPKKMTVPIMLHHIHYYVPEGAVPEIKAWYVKMFGAAPAKRP